MTSSERNDTLDGPFTHHVYIGFSPKDEKIVRDLQRELEKNEVSCFLRATNGGVQTSIQAGVGKSRKCLLVLSSAYLEDKWFTYERATVLEKVNLFGRDTLIVTKIEEQLQVPENLKGFRETVLSPEAIACLVTTIIAEPKMIMRYGPAAGYFHGYLRIILPEFRERLIEQTVQPEWRPNTLKKMLIIVPESCKCPTSMIEPGKIEFTERFVLYAGNRAGNIKRDYKNSLYKVIDTQTNKNYYFAGEFATPLLTLYETFESRLCNMSIDDLSTERDIFYCTLKTILDHPVNAACRNQFKFVYWTDPETKKPNSLKLHDFLLSFLKQELELEGSSEASLIQESGGADTSNPGPMFKGFVPTPNIVGANPASLYEGITTYPMSRTPRGICLILNFINFERNEATGICLDKREGSEKDTDILKTLFEDLHFEVETYTDLTSDSLEDHLIAMSGSDQSNYDAFVCCILSHGELGEIYTSDGTAKKILDIVKFFADEKCPTLKGKPKMFFIQACQSRGNDGQQGESSGQPSVASSQSDAKPGGAIPDFESASRERAGKARGLHEEVHVPSYPDFLMSYSTLPGSVSYRNIESGSYYVHALQECLRGKNAIDRALMKVTTKVREKLEARRQIDQIDPSKQLPFHLTSAMERLIIL